MAGEKKKPEHWTVGKWREFAQYCCAYCPFDTLDEESIRDHYLKVHFSSQPIPPISVPGDHLEEMVN